MPVSGYQTRLDTIFPFSFAELVKMSIGLEFKILKNQVCPPTLVGLNSISGEFQTKVNYQGGIFKHFK